MHDIYARLGVPADADAREIRKAYARELRKIDQETEAAAFQTLRQAYEMALQLTARDSQSSPPPQPVIERTSEKAPRQVPAFFIPPTNSEKESAEELAHLAWARCLASMPQEAQIDELTWDEALREALAHDFLVNLDSRIWFESLVVRHLTDGSHPGHESLFLAANRQFGWEEAPDRIMRFQTGALVRSALHELRLFEGVQFAQRTQLRAAICRMRDPRPPDAGDLQQYSSALVRLNRLFPNLMAVILDADVFLQWRQARVTEPVFAEPITSSRASLGKVLVWLLVIAIIAPIFVSKVSSWGSREPDHIVSQVRLQEIGTRIAYRASPSQKKVLTVEYEVFLDADRAFLGMNLKRKSGDDRFDQAVANAIRETPPFPPNTVTVFRARYSISPAEPKP
ncbi:MAG TPA: TonB C-terminal domain-containing protein [Duganella sp.]|uniref:TonB C-terminal domain-containing protein n=1 Tax=Duganella sp. TaxID=1904440 RepID=UPI002ED0D7A7